MTHDLPHAPSTFRELVLADLLRAQRLMLRVQDEIDPQFRIASPEGDWWIAMTLADDLNARESQMQLIARFMRWKLSPAFTMASQYHEPDAIACVGISYHECYGAMSLILRNPLRFGDVEWLTAAQIGDELRALLPKGSGAINAEALAELDEWFGADGRFPALRVEQI